MMLKHFMTRLRQEWTVISGAPAAFIIIVVLTSLLVFFMIRHHYEGVILSLKEVQKTRMRTRDAQLEEYRERLLLLPASGSGWSGMNNHELRQRTLVLVREIREFVERTRQEERNITESTRDSLMKAESTDEKNRFLEFNSDALSMFILKRNAEYNRRFKASAIELRDELLSRLPEGSKNRRVFDGYEYPVDPAGIEMIADDLNRMAELLD